MKGLINRVGSRLIISGILASQFLISGGLAFLDPSVPVLVQYMVLSVGLVIMALGTYMSLSAVAPTPNLATGEQEIIVRHPSMKPAYARVVLSIPFIGATGYLFTFTEYPYIYPFVTFMVGLYFLFKGIMKYMRNLHITYTITDRRVMQMYKFLWLHTKEIPVARLISISESRSFFEILTGRGTVVATAGIGSGQIVKIEEIDNITPVAEALREMLPSNA